MLKNDLKKNIMDDDVALAVKLLKNVYQDVFYLTFPSMVDNLAFNH